MAAKRLPSTLLNMFLVLTLIALISAAALAFTYSQTQPVLEALQQQRQIEAIAQVVPTFDNQPLEDRGRGRSRGGAELFRARRGGRLVGTAVRSASPNGYGGPIEIMVGFDPEGRITGVTVLGNRETPGLGAKVSDPAFLAQFRGVSAVDPLAVAKDGGIIDAITAATISSRAFCEAINLAYAALQEEGGQ